MSHLSAFGDLNLYPEAQPQIAKQLKMQYVGDMGRQALITILGPSDDDSIETASLPQLITLAAGQIYNEKSTQRRIAAGEHDSGGMTDDGSFGWEFLKYFLR